jgi:hypothetical protein
MTFLVVDDSVMNARNDVMSQELSSLKASNAAFTTLLTTLRTDISEIKKNNLNLMYFVADVNTKILNQITALNKTLEALDGKRTK